MLKKLYDFTAFKIFGVCDYLADKFDVNVDKIRLYFIYSTFAMLGTPVVLYLLLSFVLEIRNVFKRKRFSVWSP